MSLIRIYRIAPFPSFPPCVAVQCVSALEHRLLLLGPHRFFFKANQGLRLEYKGRPCPPFWSSPPRSILVGCHPHFVGCQATRSLSRIGALCWSAGCCGCWPAWPYSRFLKGVWLPLQPGCHIVTTSVMWAGWVAELLQVLATWCSQCSMLLANVRLLNGVF